MNMDIQIGVDEVGRGCVFGPLVVGAAAIIPGKERVEGCTDSKKFTSEKTRTKVRDLLAESCHYSCAFVHANIINSRGISASLYTSTKVVICDLADKMAHLYPGSKIKVVIDGTGWQALVAEILKERPKLSFHFEPKADVTVYECSAASIIAKVARDEWCHHIVQEEPALRVYGIDRNFGYGTLEHTKALKDHGMTRWHREVFCCTLLKNHNNKSDGVNITK